MGVAETLILGAGVSGLAAVRSSGCIALEAEPYPGGICRSYYQKPGSIDRLPEPPEDGGAYRFEVGGGHWIFGSDPGMLRLLRDSAALDQYERKAAVYFPGEQRMVPFPLQYHLSYLDPGVAERAQEEIKRGASSGAKTMAEWLEATFGPTLTRLFFGPFHERYTSGLWTRIAPQDGYKTPIDLARVELGFRGEDQTAGYNTTFHYPRHGLQGVADRMAGGEWIEFGKRLTSLNLGRSEIEFADGQGARYQTLLSTLPLNRMARMAGLETEHEPAPSTSVLVLNLGARKGPCCPEMHWVYVPESLSGFYRVGFYSNVDAHFLPRGSADRVSLYVERSYPDGQRPAEEKIREYAASVVKELQSWRFIGEVELISPTWVDVAYTWELPGSNWRAQALAALEQKGVHMAGRYGCWRFQGILESMRDGFNAGMALRAGGM